MSDHPQQGPANPDEPDEPDFAEMLASLLGSADNPELTQALAAMGIDKLDPASMAIMGAQLKSMFSAGGDTDPFNVALANDVARKSVAAEGDSVVGAAASRASSAPCPSCPRSGSMLPSASVVMRLLAIAF